MKKNLYSLTLAALALMQSQSHGTVIGEWTFDTGGSTAERLSASGSVNGVTVSALSINPAVEDFGVNAVPSRDNDGMGFGETGSGNQVIFWHRANFFNSDGIGTTTWSAPGFDGIDTTTGTAPMSLTVTASAGFDVTVESISVISENSGYLLYFQEAGQSAGIESGGATALTTAALSAPVAIPAGTSKTFTLNWNSGALNDFFNVDAIQLNGTVEFTGTVIGEWTFDSGQTTAERLASSAVKNGVIVSSLVINETVEDFGPEAVPDSNNDGMGFGTNIQGNQVLFWHRANFFNSDGIGTTTWSVPGLDGVDTTIATAPMSFTVTAKAGYDVTIESITVESENSGYLLYFQQAGQAAGQEFGGATATTTALLTSSVVIPEGTSKTFTLNWNSGALNDFFNVDVILLNGVVERSGNGTPQWAGYDILDAAGDVDTGKLLGFINVSGGDWVWSYSLAKWIYLPEGLVTQSGTWTYVPANQ